MNDWPSFDKRDDVACSSCNLTMTESHQLAVMDKVITFMHAAHTCSNDPVRTRMFLEQALMLLGERLTLTNE